MSPDRTPTALSADDLRNCLRVMVRLGVVPQASADEALVQLVAASPNAIDPAILAWCIGVEDAVVRAALLLVHSAKSSCSEGTVASPDRKSTSPDTEAVAATTPAASPLVEGGVEVPRSLGPYDLISKIGQGGMGIVFRARHRTLGSECAVKVLPATDFASSESIARFHREAGAVARMGKHPNIVSVHDLGHQGSVYYYAMELVEGRSLRDAAAQAPLAPREAAVLMAKVARGVQFAHQHGIIHRDLKPENILVRADGEPLVADFGVARDLGASERISLSGQVMGTLAYMAPEQARGEVVATGEWSDVYALGGILYELLVGRPPHPSGTPAVVLGAILTGAIPPPRRVRPTVPKDLETIALKCLCLEPRGRYPRAESVAEDLDRWLRGEPVHARRTGVAGRLVRWVRRRPLIASLVGATGILAGLVGWWQLGPASVMLCTDPAGAIVEVPERAWFRVTKESRRVDLRPEEQARLPADAPPYRTEEWQRVWVWPPGEFAIEIRASGHEARSLNVFVRGGSSTVLADPRSGPSDEPPKVLLKPACSYLSMDSDPHGAKVALDPRARGPGPRPPLHGAQKSSPIRTPLDRLKIPPGSHVVRVEADGHAPTELQFDAQVGTHVQLGTIRLEKLESSLSVRGTTENMVVTLREADSGKTVTEFAPPLSGLGLMPGAYCLSARADDHFDQEVKVVAQAGAAQVVTIALAPSTLWQIQAVGEVLGAPWLGDLDSDGAADLVVSMASGGLQARRGRDGLKMWEVRTSCPLGAPLGCSDLDRDGVPDFVLVTTGGQALATSGRDGEPIWQRQMATPLRAPPGVGDLDCDGWMDVLVGGEDGAVRAFGGEDGKDLWSATPGGHIRAGLVVVDLDSDSRSECLACSTDGTVHCLDGVTGKARWKSMTGYAVLATPATGDLDGDSVLDCLVGSNDHRVYAISGRDGSRLWTVEATRPFRVSPLLVDLDRDGLPECIVISDDGRLRNMDGRTGSQRWSVNHTLPMQDRPTLVNLNDDGVLDLLVVRADGRVSGVSGRDGKHILVNDQKCGRAAVPVVGDLDGQRGDEMVVSRMDGSLLATRLPPGSGVLPVDPMREVLAALHGGKWRVADELARRLAASTSDHWASAVAENVLGMARLRLSDAKEARAAFRRARGLGLRSPVGAVHEWIAFNSGMGSPTEASASGSDVLRETYARHPDAVLDALLGSYDLLTAATGGRLREALDAPGLPSASRATSVVIRLLLASEAVPEEDLVGAAADFRSRLDSPGAAARMHGYLAILAAASNDLDGVRRERAEYLEADFPPPSLRPFVEALTTER